MPDALKKRFPQLEQINAAIAEFKESGVTTTRCPKCNEVIRVVEVLGRLVTSCGCGHCRYSVAFAIQ